MKKFLRLILIALFAILLSATIALVGCSQGNVSALPPSTEQGDTGEGNRNEQEKPEDNLADEGKPSLPGGLVDGGEFSGNRT